MEARFEIGDIFAIGLTLIVAGIAIAYGLQITGDVKDEIGETNCAARSDTFTSYNETAGQCYNSSGNHIDVGTSEFNATEDAIEGVAKFPEKFPTIATVIVAAIVIGVLITYLWRRV